MRTHRFLSTIPRRLTTAKTQGVPLILVTIFPIVGLSQELHKFDSLTDAVYHFEVTIYCGLATDTVAQGYRQLEKKFTLEGNLTPDEIDQARGKGWQLAHAEWQNRGLGGFRAWCAGDGQKAARALSSAAEPG